MEADSSKIPINYTTGELRALIAPIFNTSAENIDHIAIIVTTQDGHLQGAIPQCPHGLLMLQSAYEKEVQMREGE